MSDVMFEGDDVFFVGNCENCGYKVVGKYPTVCEGCGLDVAPMEEE
jgi:hypothetical protein